MRVAFPALVAVLCGAMQSPGPPAEQRPRFRASVDAVLVDVLVTDRGKPVSGLTAADFELRDEGVLQRVELATTASSVNLILSLDASGSLAGEKLTTLKAAIRALTGALRKGDTASFVLFSRPIELLTSAEGDPSVIERRLDTISAGGRTALFDAVYASIALSEAALPRPLMILFSDGEENASWLSKTSVLESLKRAAVVVYSVPARESSAYAVRLLTEFSDVSGGRILYADADRKLPSVFVEILDEFRSRYLLTYTPAGVTRADGWHRIAVRLKTKPGHVKARPGYFGGLPRPTERGPSGEPSAVSRVPD